jgi:glycosyltransferase involved in cell wall biosynthesis
MRVLILNRYLGFRSGVEKFLYDLARELERSGHWAALAHEEDRADPAGYRAAFRETARLPLYGGDPEAVVGEIVERTRPDLVFAHNVRNPAWVDVFGRACPTVQMVHDVEPFCLNGKKYFHLTTQGVCDKPLGALCYARCTGLRRSSGTLLPLELASLTERRERLRVMRGLARVLVCSSFMEGELVRNGVPAEGIDVLPVFVEVPGEPPPYPAGSRLALFVGRLNREKGVKDFLRALARLRGDWRAAVVGEGDPSAAARLAAGLGLAARVTFEGFLPFDSVRALYRRAAVVVMPSLWPEPLGMVGLEAMAHARPVVGYASGGILEWLAHRETGILVRRRDVDALADGIQELLDQPALAARMGSAAYARIRGSRYTSARFLERFVRLANAAAAETLQPATLP